MTERKQKINRGLLLVCCLCIALGASAQKTFNYAAKVGPVDTPGFYSIALQPDLVAESKADLSDLRLIDDSGHFVPYVLAQGQPPWMDNSAPYFAFPAVAARSAADSGTTYVVKNIAPAPVNNLFIKLKNAAVERTLNLFGSDDLIHWYVIEENIAIQPAASANGSDYDQQLSFPPSNYHYIKLMVNDKHKGSIKFLAAGTYQQRSLPVKYSEIAGAKFVKKDSGKNTYITISLAGNYWVDMITLGIKAPKFYNRNVSIYDISGRQRELLSTDAIRSDIKGVLPVEVKTSKLLLEIDNEDSPPLSVAQVSLFQTERSALAYLEAGKAYQLLTGDPNAVAPSYDLKFFTDSARNRALKINHGSVKKNTLYVAPVSAAKPTNERGVFIWAAIAVALLLLTLLTLKMAGDVKKRI
jgi:hypothetical protein